VSSKTRKRRGFAPCRRPRVDASNHRKGSGEDWVAFLEKAPVAEAFAYASDYPHEVDLVAAKEMIHDTVENKARKYPRGLADRSREDRAFPKER
jgi:hypothetical protein